MKTLKYITLATAMLFPLVSCDSFLEESPKAVADSEALNASEETEKMVIAAYSSLGNENAFTGFSALWAYGDLRSGDSYKGGDGPGDMGDLNLFETFVYMRDDVSYLDQKWYHQYIAIARANDALGRINQLDEADYPMKKIRQAEMRFLRAHFYFELKTLYKHVPYVDETIPTEEYINISNVEYSSADLWEKLIGEFRFAAENLPDNNGDVGRANRGMAKAYLAKTLLYAAYEQDEKHNVTAINKEKLEEVVKLCKELNGHYSLAPDFANNFLCETENGPESVFAIQFSHADGTFRGRLDWGAMLNYPMNPEYGCCGFHQPTQNMVNAFRTDENGLPLLDTFNEKNLETADDLLANYVDPRLNHTVAIPGLPYKYNPEFIFQSDWNRSTITYGHFMSMKETVLPDCPCFAKADPFMSSSKNRDIIRYADVLLWQAEALIELGRPDEALSLINQIRERAAQSTGKLVDIQGAPTGNFKTEIYKPGVNCPAWTQEFARKALRFERRLEFSQEGIRFFDLVRWGNASEVINKYLEKEKTRRGAYLQEAKFTKNRDEYFPIPKAQINFSKKLYEQNYGW